VRVRVEGDLAVVAELAPAATEHPATAQNEPVWVSVDTAAVSV